MVAATLCGGDKDGVDLQLERRRREGQQRPVPRRRHSAATPAAGPLPLPSPSGARRRKPRRRPPPLPPRPVDSRAAHDACAIPPPVDARARQRLPIDDGGEVDGDGGDGGAALPVANKSPSSSSSGALDGDAAEAEARRRLTSSRREALGPYWDILRVTRLFEWPDDRGVPWREVLQANARREFEEARGEHDPEVVARLLVGGRDAVQQALDRLAEASRRMVEAEEAKRRCYDVERGVLVWERDEHEGRRVWATARHRPVLFALTLATAAAALPFSPRAPATVAPPPPSSLPPRQPPPCA
uniref:Complex 1 LYR protein domain-containing protein n=1 Tax=Oryza meridionalis TaxID=40149 RepID=A0A0E0E2Q6_9ORYZ